jgi:hypothetical protein
MHVPEACIIGWDSIRYPLDEWMDGLTAGKAFTSGLLVILHCTYATSRAHVHSMQMFHNRLNTPTLYLIHAKGRNEYANNDQIHKFTH